MVKRLFTLSLTFLLVPILSFALEVEVRSEIEQGHEGKYLRGTLTITHNESAPVDVNSITLDGKKLSAERIKEVELSPGSGVMISIYRFQLPPQPPGDHLLPAISVKVGGTVHQSLPERYQVEERRTLATPKSGAILKLEAEIEAEQPIYPGQRVRFIYRYRYNTSVEMREEKLPLLEATGFRKVGSKVIKDYVEGDFNVQEVSQIAEALAPGTYQFGSSVIAGYPYEEDLSGKRTYSTEELRAEVEPFSITVEPLPESVKPLSFSGAVGEYRFGARLATSNQVSVGDKMTLIVKIAGEGNLQEVVLPNLSCQPGFSGLFQLDAIPPIGKIEGNVKSFEVSLWPLSSLIWAIPPIEFTYFDPQTQKYVSLHSHPIPITVASIPIQDQTVQASQKGAIAMSEGLSPPPIEKLSAYPLSLQDLETDPLSTWWALLLLPAGSILLIGQLALKRELTRRKKSKRSSHEIYEEAIRENSLQLLEQACRRYAEENPSQNINSLIDQLVEVRYAKDQTLQPSLSAHIAALFTLPPTAIKPPRPSPFSSWWVPFTIAIIPIVIAFWVHSITSPTASLNQKITAVDRSETLFQREVLLNTLLADFNALNTPSSGYLEANLSKVYLALGDDAQSLLFAYRAHQKMPRNQEIIAQITAAQKALLLPTDSPLPIALSLTEKLHLFSLSFLIALLLLSTLIWTEKAPWTKRLATLFLTLSLLMAGSALYSWYFSPIEAILLQATTLHRDAGTQFPKVGPKPLPTGTKVQVIELRNNGHWLKITTPTDEVGFVPSASLELI